MLTIKAQVLADVTLECAGLKEEISQLKEKATLADTYAKMDRVRERAMNARPSIATQTQIDCAD